jgi:hypothetical protein
VDITCLPPARETLSGRVNGCLLTTRVPSITKIWVAPESAIVLSVASQNATPTTSEFTICLIAQALYDLIELWQADIVDVGTVISSPDMQNWVGYDKLLVLT